jgi:hypothetical protein
MQPTKLLRPLVVIAFVALPACNGAVDGDAPEPTTDDPRADALRINEVVASNATTCPDAAGEFDDWIELVNLDDVDVALDGVTITDDRSARDKGSLDGLTIPANGRLVLFADGAVAQGNDHLPFKLSAAGEELLICIDGAVIDEVTWTAALPDQAQARFPDGSGDFVTCAATTCGQPNGDTCP